MSKKYWIPAVWFNTMLQISMTYPYGGSDGTADLCAFCDTPEGEDHEHTCLWLRAQRLVAQQNKEYTVWYYEEGDA